MKAPLGREVELDPGHIVLGGHFALPRNRALGTTAPSFGPRLLWPRSPMSATAELLLIRIKKFIEYLRISLRLDSIYEYKKLMYYRNKTSISAASCLAITNFKLGTQCALPVSTTREQWCPK